MIESDRRDTYSEYRFFGRNRQSMRTSLQIPILSLGIFGFVAVLSSCASTEYADQADEVVEQPDESVDLQGLGAQRWCSDFGQSGLDGTVERVWSDNMALKAATNSMISTTTPLATIVPPTSDFSPPQRHANSGNCTSPTVQTVTMADDARQNAKQTQCNNLLETSTSTSQIKSGKAASAFAIHETNGFPLTG